MKNSREQNRFLLIKISWFISLVIFGLVGVRITNIYAASKLLTIENEFIKIIVNNEDFDKGRFAIETTNGDPNKNFDDNQPLIYGRPKPWTSYTTINIDGKIYSFGGKTVKRAGKNTFYGEFVSQIIKDNSIITAYKYGNIYVTQTLSFLRNPNTKVKDTVLINYETKNLDNVEHKIGLRIMLDTMLGANDGAPFRIGEKAIESESEFVGNEILDYWQTFDNLVSPNIIAQGTLKLDSDQVNPPDKMCLANWGTLADNAWDFTYQEGRTFIRDGETVNDTALVLYWNPKTILPMGKLSVKTLYGLGSVSLASGDLTLGLASPQEIYATSKSTVLIVGYILNSGNFDSKNTRVSFIIPKEFKILKGKTNYSLGLLKIKEAKQIPLNLIIEKPIAGEKNIVIKVESDTLESNFVTRSISLIEPPSIFKELIAPTDYSVSDNNYLKLEVVLKNDAGIRLNNIKSEIYFDESLELPFFELKKKEISSLAPNETKKINWYLKFKDYLKNMISVKVNVFSSETGLENKEIVLDLTKPDNKLMIKADKSEFLENQYFCLTLVNKSNINDKDISINFDPNFLKLIRISLYPILSKALIENNLIIDKLNGVINLKNLTLNNNDYFENNLIKFNFRVLRKGESKIILKKDDLVIDEITIKAEEAKP
ncbi:MAG: hypothetical protein WC860_07235 [Candidatus Margulisiibacteriota bacterium]|jgi:hypothetical protein